MENIIEKLLPFAQSALGLYIFGTILGMAVFVIIAIWVLKGLNDSGHDDF